MSTTTIRISRELHARLEALAQEQGKPIGQVVERLVSEHDQKAFFQGLADDFRRLRSDPVAWQEYQEELREWDGVLADGLQAFPYEADE